MNEQSSIRCPQCKRVSCNPNDVQFRYCSYCHAFHSDMRGDTLIARRIMKSVEPVFGSPREVTHAPYLVITHRHLFDLCVWGLN